MCGASSNAHRPPLEEPVNLPTSTDRHQDSSLGTFQAREEILGLPGESLWPSRCPPPEDPSAKPAAPTLLPWPPPPGGSSSGPETVSSRLDKAPLLCHGKLLKQRRVVPPWRIRLSEARRARSNGFLGARLLETRSPRSPRWTATQPTNARRDGPTQRVCTCREGSPPGRAPEKGPPPRTNKPRGSDCRSSAWLLDEDGTGPGSKPPSRIPSCGLGSV